MSEEEKKEERADEYTNISIEVIENGVLVTIPPGSKVLKRGDRIGGTYGSAYGSDTICDTKLIFKNVKELNEWLGEHLAPTGEKRKFLDGLEEDPIDSLREQITNIPYVSTPGVGTGDMTWTTTSDESQLQTLETLAEQVKNAPDRHYKIETASDMM
jgi:hypothetical protein